MLGETVRLILNSIDSEQECGYTRQHINRLASAQKIQEVLEPMGSKNEIPERQLRPLSKLPDDEIRKQI